MFFISVVCISSHLIFWRIIITGKLTVKFVGEDGILIGCSLFATGRSVSDRADVVLFMLSLFLFTFGSSRCSLGYSVGVGGMEKLLRHSLGQLFTRPGFPLLIREINESGEKKHKHEKQERRQTE